MKTVVLPYDELCIEAAEQIIDAYENKPEACFAFSAGEEQEGIYEALAMLCKMKGLRLSRCSIFLVNEYEGIPPNDGRSCAGRLSSLLYGSGVEAEQIIIPGADNISQLDAMIEQRGGIDLALLGLGGNCRIGFNEPATPYNSPSRLQKLTDSTRKESAQFFGAAELVPEYGYTIGINSLINARRHIIAAAGEEKAEAVFQTLYARTDSYRPSAFWQLPLQVTLYADTDAAAKL